MLAKIGQLTYHQGDMQGLHKKPNEIFKKKNLNGFGAF